MIDEKDGGVKQGKAGANLGEETTNPQNPDLGIQLGQPGEPFGFAGKFHVCGSRIALLILWQVIERVSASDELVN